MTKEERMKVEMQVQVLHDLLPVYGGKTLDNVLDRLEARLQEDKQNR